MAISEVLALLRACLTVLLVAALSFGITILRDAQGEGSAPLKKISWVRTVDGWEPISVLNLAPPPQGPPALHPVLVATLQVGLSVFGLLALPTASPATRKS